MERINLKMSVSLEKELEFAHLNLDLNTINFDQLRNPFAGYHSIDDAEEILKNNERPSQSLLYP